MVALKAVLLNDTSVEDHHGCSIVVDQLVSGLDKYGINVSCRVPLSGGGLFDMSKLRGFDLCIINGEGTMHHDSVVALALCEVASYCSENGIPCFLVNSVWQDNVLLNRYLKDFTAVYFRDQSSAQAAAEYCPRVEVVPDLTMLTDFSSLIQCRKGFLCNGSVLEDQQQKLIDDVLPSFHGEYISIRCLPRLFWGGAGIFFYSFRRWLKCLRHWLISSLIPLSRGRKKKRVSRFRWRHAVISRASFLKKVSGAEGILTGRYHMVTLCLASHTPFLAVSSNTGKIEALLSDVGIGGRVLSDFCEVREMECVPKFSRDELLAIDNYIDYARRRADFMFSEILRMALSASQA